MHDFVRSLRTLQASAATLLSANQDNCFRGPWGLPACLHVPSSRTLLVQVYDLPGRLLCGVFGLDPLHICGPTVRRLETPLGPPSHGLGRPGYRDGTRKRLRLRFLSSSEKKKAGSLLKVVALIQDLLAASGHQDRLSVLSWNVLLFALVPGYPLQPSCAQPRATMP